MRIAVASKNPVKIQAALDGLKLAFKSNDFTAIGYNISSGVPEQPNTDAETFQGAFNRVMNLKNVGVEADYFLGLEGGLIWHSETELEAMAWIIVLNASGKLGKSRTAGFYLPLETINLLKTGLELGHADELFHGLENSKQGLGTTGILTHGVIDRKNYYTQSVILACIPFTNPELYT